MAKTTERLAAQRDNGRVQRLQVTYATQLRSREEITRTEFSRNPYRKGILQ